MIIGQWIINGCPAKQIVAEMERYKRKDILREIGVVGGRYQNLETEKRERWHFRMFYSREDEGEEVGSPSRSRREVMLLLRPIDAFCNKQRLSGIAWGRGPWFGIRRLCKKIGWEGGGVVGEGGPRLQIWR